MSATANIPFLDLVTPHQDLEDDLVEVFRQALHTASFIGGSMVDNFETTFADFCGVRHAIGVGSGTDALRFALFASGIRQGDVVLTAPNTFIATTEAITQCGAWPEFIDIDENTYNISPEKLRLHLSQCCTRDRCGRLISHRTNRPVTAIVPVHLYGQVADMDTIMDIADEYGLIVVEDACQAHGAEYFSAKRNQWLKAGAMSHAAAFSFYPGKNLGACGEAGATVTNDAEIAATIRMLRDHGQAQKYHHDVEGYNGRLDAIQAGVLHAKLSHLPEWNQQRRERSAEYSRRLAKNNAIICPFEPAWSRAAFHLYVIRTNHRDQLITHLNDAGVHTGIHYPVPLHMQKAYRWLNYREGDLPVAERVAAEIISLPMFPQMTAAQQNRVIHEIESFVTKRPMRSRSRPPVEKQRAIAA